MAKYDVTEEERRLIKLNTSEGGDWRGPDKVLGPVYPDLGATVAKFRRRAAYHGSIMGMPKSERHAYADAVEKAIRAKHRVLHVRPSPPTTPGWYNPPSVTRLLRYEHPIKMQGDPDWDPGHDRDGDRWHLRERAVYAAAMEARGNRTAIAALQAAA
jgi:hypothetical protein